MRELSMKIECSWHLQQRQPHQKTPLIPSLSKDEAASLVA